MSEIITTNWLNIGEIEKRKLIPGFRYLSEPDYRWFDHQLSRFRDMQIPEFKDESPYDWAVVNLGSEALAAMYALGLPSVMVSWDNPWKIVEGDTSVILDLRDYSYELREVTLENARNQGLNPAEVDEGVYEVKVSPATEIALAVRYRDIYPLARYFVLASRVEFRNPAYAYGGLPPGIGYGEYEMPQPAGREPVIMWIPQKEKLDRHYIDVLSEDRFTELKAPDSGSLLDDGVDYERDTEWLDSNFTTVGTPPEYDKSDPDRYANLRSYLDKPDTFKIRPEKGRGIPGLSQLDDVVISLKWFAKQVEEHFGFYFTRYESDLDNAQPTLGTYRSLIHPYLEPELEGSVLFERIILVGSQITETAIVTIEVTYDTAIDVDVAYKDFLQLAGRFASLRNTEISNVEVGDKFNTNINIILYEPAQLIIPKNEESALSISEPMPAILYLTDREVNTLAFVTDRGYLPEELYDEMHLADDAPEDDYPPDLERPWVISQRGFEALLRFGDESQALIGGSLLEKLQHLLSDERFTVGNLPYIEEDAEFIQPVNMEDLRLLMARFDGTAQMRMLMAALDVAYDAFLAISDPDYYGRKEFNDLYQQIRFGSLPTTYELHERYFRPLRTDDVIRDAIITSYVQEGFGRNLIEIAILKSSFDHNHYVPMMGYYGTIESLARWYMEQMNEDSPEVSFIPKWWNRVQDLLAIDTPHRMGGDWPQTRKELAQLLNSCDAETRKELALLALDIAFDYYRREFMPQLDSESANFIEQVYLAISNPENADPEIVKTVSNRINYMLKDELANLAHRTNRFTTRVLEFYIDYIHGTMPLSGFLPEIWLIERVSSWYATQECAREGQNRLSCEHNLALFMPIWWQVCQDHLDIKNINTVGQPAIQAEATDMQQLLSFLGDTVTYADEYTIEFEMENEIGKITFYEIDETPIADIQVDNLVQTFVFPTAEVILEALYD